MITTRQTTFEAQHGPEHRALLASAGSLSPAELERLEKLHVREWRARVIDSIESQAGPDNAQRAEAAWEFTEDFA